MEIRHLRYFCGIAEHKSFSKAATRLHIAQPSLSRQIRDLETELGVPLFIRSSTGVQLTDAGEAFRVQSEKILAQLAIAVSTAQEIGRGKGGEFIIGGDWRLAIDTIPLGVAEIRKQFPRVNVRLVDMPVHEQLMALRERRIHIGFVPLEYIGASDNVESAPFLSDNIAVTLPKRHPLAKRSQVRLQELAKETWVLIDDEEAPGASASFARVFRMAQINPKLGPTSNSVQGLIARVCAGDGITMIPRGMLPESHPQLAFVETDVEPFFFHAVWPRQGASPLVQPFLKILEEAMKGRSGATVVQSPN